jgi:hypothetical protein
MVQGSSEEYNQKEGGKKTLNEAEIKVELDSSGDGDENQSLLHSKKAYQSKFPGCYKFKRWMSWIVSLEKREI